MVLELLTLIRDLLSRCSYDVESGATRSRTKLSMQNENLQLIFLGTMDYFDILILLSEYILFCLCTIAFCLEGCIAYHNRAPNVTKIP